MLAAVGYAAAYTGVGLALLLVGFWVLDLLTPGKLAQRVWRDGEPGAAIVSAAGALGLGLIVFTAIWRNATSGFGTALGYTVVFGLVGVVLQAVAFVVLDRLTPDKLGDLLGGVHDAGSTGGPASGGVHRMHPAVLVMAAFQLAVSGIIVASIA